ncbi:MAG: dUTP diphosphatase [Planctomycetes bacterium]|nr:dUTP diphosphatase [Planctomycetota bacterium]
MATDPVIRVQRLPHYPFEDLPAYATAGSCGMDLRSTATLSVAPQQRVLIPTGLRIAVPPGYEAQIRPRSGLALKHGITLPNSPGTIDSDYRGELKVILLNLGTNAFAIETGDRIAQLVIAPVSKAVWSEEIELDASLRGEGGFGHTGVK